MEVLRAADRKSTPWKNGGGLTAEIAAHPSGASLETFAWRVSTAVVAQAGTFSAFSGIDRRLLLLSGEGLTLRIGDTPAVTVTSGGPPVAFPGDVPVHAELVAGPVTDLNVMTRRSAWSSRVRRCKLSDADFAVFAVEITMVIALGSLSARAAADEFEALPCDAILMAAGESLTLLAAERGAEFVLIDLWQTR